MVAISQFVNITINVSQVSTVRAGFGRPMGIFTHAVGGRQAGPFSSVAAVTAAGLGAPSIAWATAIFSQQPAPREVMIGQRLAGDANWTATMDAIELAGPGSWYGTNVETRAEADILLVAAWMESRKKILIAQSSDAAIKAGTAGNLFEDFKTALYNRTAGVFHGTNGEYLDAAWMGRCLAMDLDSPDGQGTWDFKQVSGVPTADVFTDAEVTNIYDDNGNLWASADFSAGIQSQRFVSQGTMGSGRFVDITVTNDWLQARLEEAILGVFLAAPNKIPFTDGGIEMVRGAAMGVFERGVNFGHFARDAASPTSGRKTPFVDAPRASTISAADKAARRLTLSAEAVYAGAIHRVGGGSSTGFQVNLQF